ncbi:hypothetical protein Leryth_024887 [Lithospermum erythrorhizon]|uniref:Uncharacterized protein n=1 Tax=Lithospermum erythrorhizon TaxID=34254 RepID=A0AAV3QHT2_LITER|nr:hypothetical protein Leryth_024887 [Lithospermum erythrorhizon]
MSSYNNFNCKYSSNPCLNWMNSSVLQDSAVTILAKFYNPKEVLDILCHTPQHRRAGVLVCLLYEVCGRLLDPENGLEGLFRSGHWEKCYYAVRAILKGETITPLPTSNPIHQMTIGIKNVVVTIDELDNNKYIENKGKRPMVDDDGDEEPINPSKRQCSSFERGESSEINQKSEIFQFRDPGDSSSSNSNVDEVSLELTLGRPNNSTNKCNNED